MMEVVVTTGAGTCVSGILVQEIIFVLVFIQFICNHFCFYFM